MTGKPNIIADAVDRWRSMWEKEHNHNEELAAENRALLAAKEDAEAERDALRDKLALAADALQECQQEIDHYSQNEYPSDHPVHERYRKRDYDANPARVALATLDQPKEGDSNE